MKNVIDYAWDRPNPAGYIGVIRYLSYDTSGKTITFNEFRDLRNRGFLVGLVWETSANRATKGRAAGESDAKEAVRQAAALGYNGVIYAAVDYDAQSLDEIKDYFTGFTSVAGKSRVGVYGSYNVCVWLHNARLVSYCWQTLAWSRGKIYSGACLYQYDFHNAYDGNKVLRADWGQYPRPAKPKPSKPKKNPPKPPPKKTC